MPTVADLRVRFSADIGGALTGIRKVDDGVHRLQSSVNSALGGINFGQMFNVAGGNLISAGIRNIASSVAQLGGEALGIYSDYERLTMSLETFAAQELIASGGADSMSEALAMSGERAQEVLGWIENLAVQSPFESKDISAAFRLAQAYGFTSDQAMRLTQATVDFAAGAGISGANMDRISLALGQIQARGKVSAQELNQLSESGINARQILANAFGVSTAKIMEMVEKGLVPADLAIEAITQTLEKDFGGAAKRQSATFSGLISSLSDLKSIGLREFFRGTFTAVQPLLQEFVGYVTDPAVKENLRAWGDTLGQYVAGKLEYVRDLFALVSQSTTFSGGLFAALGNLTGGEVQITAEGMITSVNWGDFVGVLDWKNYVASLSWGSFVGTFAWGEWVTSLAWGNFILAFDWNDWVGTFAWGDFVSIVNWADWVYTLAWGDYLINLDWGNWVFSLQWGDYVLTLNWSQYLTTLTSWSTFISQLTWTDVVTAFNGWSAYISKLTWTDIVVDVLDWAMWIPALSWAGFVTALEWSMYLLPVAWNSFITALDWVIAVGGSITWADFIAAIDWTAYVATFTWGSFISHLEWTGTVAKLEDWSAYVSAIDWTGFITSLDWTQIFVTTIDWGAYITTLPWNAFVAALDWSVYLSPLVWSALINTTIDWGTYVSTINWSDHIMGALNWATYASVLAWDKYVHFLAWGEVVEALAWSRFVSYLNWPTFATSLSWSEFVATIDWTKWVTAVEWSGFIVSLTWSAFVPSLSWAAFISALDLASYIPSFPGWKAILGGGAVGNAATSAYDYVAGLIDPDHNAAGTSSWRGGLTWVDEKGPELFHFPDGRWAMGSDKGAHLANLPAGTQIYPHDDAMQMMGMAGGASVNFGKGGVSSALSWIGSNADGTTTAPTNWPGGGSTFAQNYDQRIADMSAKFGATGDKVATQIGKQMEAAAKKHRQELESALQSVPGLFGTSQVTAQQMDMAALGVPQSFADDYVRRLTDEVVNGVDWEGVDIKDAAARAGIDPSLPAEAILTMFKDAWNDSSLFAGGKNTDLINQEAVQAALQRQAAAASGKDAINALFGITPEQATGQAVALGASMRSGIEQGLMEPTASGAAGGGLLTGLTTVTPEQLAPVGVSIVDGLTAEMGKEEYADKIGAAFTKLFTGFLERKEALTDVGAQVMTRIAEGLGNATGIDMIGKFATAFRAQLALPNAIEALHDIGARILEFVFQGYSAAAKEKDWPYATVGSAGASAGTTAATTTSSNTVNPPPPTNVNASARSGALAGAGAGGPVVNVYATVGNGVDVYQLAYQVADIIQKRSRR